jgi:hypothetical protein|tara:strand:+ start:1385 stop:1558 length:174 start_codon:yes stop_codon:yes gene_type:complete
VNETFLKPGQDRRDRDRSKLAKAFRHHVAHALIVTLGKIKEAGKHLVYVLRQRSRVG